MLEQYLANFSDYVQHHPYIGELLTFVIAFAESLPLIGTIVPGSVTMTIIGILIGRNVLPLTLTLALAALGAFVGDILGFAIGKYYNERLRNVWPFKSRPHWLTLGEKFFLKHGGKSILIGRFVGPARSSIPLFAGLLKMHWPKFLVAALPSAVLWALLYIVPGILLGAISLAIPKEQGTTFTLIGLGIIVLLWLIFWAVQRFFVFLAIQLNIQIDRTWNWLSRHHASRRLIRLITNQRHPEDHYQLMRVLLAMLCFLLFLMIFISVALNIGIYQLNEPLFYLIQTLRHATADTVFVLITNFGDKYIITVATILIALFFALRRDWYTFWHVLGVTAVTSVTITVLKHFYYSPRPTGFLIVAKSSSFPSGHSTFSVAVLGFYAFLIARVTNKKWHWIPYSLTSLLVLSVLFSRLYLGAHWVCDVLAGLFLGATILLLSVTSYYRKQPLSPRSFIIWPILTSLFISWGLYSLYSYTALMHRYTPSYPKITVNQSLWWNTPLAYTPRYRINRLGNPIQPFNIQWTDSPSAIKNYLLQRGWKEDQPPQTLQKILSRFTDNVSRQHITFLHQLYRQKSPVIFLIKTLPKKNKIIELRLWHSGIYFLGTNTPLLIGSTVYYHPKKSYFSFRSQQQVTLKKRGGINELTKSLNTNYQWKIVKTQGGKVPRRVKALDWDNSILIIRRPATVDNNPLKQLNHE